MKNIISQVPGYIVEILVKEGQDVKIGDGLVVISFMKMDMTIASEYSGIVERIYCKLQETTQPGQVLIEIKD